MFMLRDDLVLPECLRVHSDTPSGYLMLTMLSGFATHEREVIRERSVAGTNRLAEAGAWLGGIVPYGYRRQGEKAEARIVLSEAPIPGIRRERGRGRRYDLPDERGREEVLPEDRGLPQSEPHSVWINGCRKA